MTECLFCDQKLNQNLNKEPGPEQAICPDCNQPISSELYESSLFAFSGMEIALILVIALNLALFIVGGSWDLTSYPTPTL